MEGTSLLPTVRHACVTLLALCAATACLPATSGAADDFGTPPAPLSESAPGDVLRAQHFIPRSLGVRLPGGGETWRILYRSTDATGRPDAVTGTLVLPRNRAPKALVSLAPGTQGMGDQCAASRQLRFGTLYEGIAIADMLRRGWAVAMTDYEGLGTPGLHTYMVGRSAGPAALDVLRAARRLDEANLPDDLPLGLVGYSQGGNAAAWAAELQPQYAPELDLVGVAAGGVPADLVTVQRNIDGGPYSGLMILGGLGLEAAYGVDIDQYHTYRGTQEYYDAQNDCLLETLVKAAFRRLSGITTIDPFDDPEIRARAEENRLGDLPPGVPVLVQHGRNDDIVPVGQAREMYDAWCAMGATARWRSNDADHIGGYLIANRRAIAWMGDRLAGRPEPGTCP